MRSEDARHEAPNTVTQILLKDAIENDRAYGFLLRHVPNFYASVAGASKADEAKDLVRRSFDALRTLSGSTASDATFSKAAELVHKGVFRFDDPNFWFTVVHQRYKKEGKPALVVPVLEDCLNGGSVLDIGGGSGYMAARLSQQGHHTEITDVIDYRDPSVKYIPFRKMPSPTKLPYKTGQFDSAIMFEVLHHVEDVDHVALMREVARVAHRVVVVEDVYGDLSHPLRQVRTDIEDAEPTRDYLAMTPQDQFQTLVLMDYFVNIAAKGIVEMNMPFNFKSIARWEEIFREAGLHISGITQIGFLRNTLNRNFQVFISLEGAP